MCNGREISLSLSLSFLTGVCYRRGHDTMCLLALLGPEFNVQRCRQYSGCVLGRVC